MFDDARPRARFLNHDVDVPRTPRSVLDGGAGRFTRRTVSLSFGPLPPASRSLDTFSDAAFGGRHTSGTRTVLPERWPLGAGVHGGPSIMSFHTTCRVTVALATFAILGSASHARA